MKASNEEVNNLKEAIKQLQDEKQLHKRTIEHLEGKHKRLEEFNFTAEESYKLKDELKVSKESGESLSAEVQTLKSENMVQVEQIEELQQQLKVSKGNKFLSQM